MACYVASNDNRFYVALEQSYGAVPAVTGANRFPAVQLAARQQVERPARRDKTGGRTFAGLPSGLRRRTGFEVKTYLTSWAGAGHEPGYGPLFQAALGGAPLQFAGGTVQGAVSARQLTLSAAHGLQPGQAITWNGELRFVESVPDAQTVELNAPFTSTPGTGAAVGGTVTYPPATALPSVSLFDRWSPAAMVQRILHGAAVNEMRIRLNGDFHEFEFQGGARDLIDSSTFAAGQGELTAFPGEPAVTDLDYALVPGHLGQAWMGAAAEQFLSITEAEVVLDNDLDFRAREFGSMYPRCLAPGTRTVKATFSMYAHSNDTVKGLYQAARQDSVVGVMFQLGQQEGQLFGVYLKTVAPEVPQWDDSERRLQWRFSNCRAQGTMDDEIFVAFG